MFEAHATLFPYIYVGVQVWELLESNQVIIPNQQNKQFTE